MCKTGGKRHIDIIVTVATVTVATPCLGLKQRIEADRNWQSAIRREKH